MVTRTVRCCYDHGETCPAFSFGRARGSPGEDAYHAGRPSVGKCGALPSGSLLFGIPASTSLVVEPPTACPLRRGDFTIRLDLTQR